MKMIVTASEAHRGTLRAAGHVYDCALGPSGVRAEKREGDGGTPAGVYPLRAIWYRTDRLPQPASTLPQHGIERDDGWCDAPADPNYNRPVKLPYRASAEKMWRDDSVYDLVVILGHNDDPPVPGKGSAIFLHIANQAFGPTEGCVALQREDLLALAQLMTPASVIDIRVD